jgi:serine/threonine-protein kinase RsbW
MNYKFKVGCSIENLKDVRDFIRTSLKNHGISDLEISEIVLA